MDGVVVTADTTGHITAWSAGVERRFGPTAADAVGASLDPIVPPDRREAQDPWGEVLPAPADTP